jgi:hypothetical protein
MASAQTVRVGVHAVSATLDEVKKEKRADGEGFGGTLQIRFGKILFEASGYQTEMSPSQESDSVDFKARQFDVRLSYRLATAVAVEVGGGRRFIDPELAAQDVGFVRIGVLSENQIARIANVWIRGAYLVAPKFSGGGESGLSVELGFGAGVGTTNGRFRVRADYEFQRIDRRIFPEPAQLELKVPIQIAVARLGVEVGF